MTGSCTTCGTGGWSGPAAGDPDNTSVLSVAPVFGGLEVSWTYPGLNPYAVAYFIVYRGVNNIFDNAIEIARISGSKLVDPHDDATTYYYWITAVSIHGTVANPIGPVSGTAVTMAAQLIEKLSQQIHDGVLATALRDKIDQIAVLQADLAQEITDREGAGITLADAIQQANDGVAEAHSFLATEIATRVEQNQAVVEALDAQAVTLGSQIAAVQTLTTTEVARLDGVDSSLASQITAAQTELEGNIASVQTTLQTNIDAVDGVVTNIGARYTALVDVNGLVGGFGIYNDGTSVEAGFNVDTFWIGNSSTVVKPFIVTGGVVYIDEARIKNLSADKLTAGTITTGVQIKSANYVAATSGWSLNGDGTTEFNQGATFRGTIDVKSSTSGERMEIKNNTIKVYDSSGILRVHLGNLSA